MADNAKDIQLRELRDSITKLNTTIEVLTASVAAANAREAALAQERDALKEQVDYLTKKLFGTSSEKSAIDIPGQMNLFNEAEQTYDPMILDETEETPVKEHSRKKKSTHAETFRGLEVRKVIIPLPDEAKICAECGTPMEWIGNEYVRRELKFIPARCEVIEYYTETYGCPNCKAGNGPTETAVFAKSEAPSALVGKGYASPSVVAWTMYQKYCNGMPLYRQEKDWKQYGVAVSRTTLANWIIHCAEQYFRPVYDHLHRQLLERSFLMADETRVQVLKEPGRSAESDSFMWLFRSGEDGLPVIVLYGYTPTRNGDHAQNFLEGFKGYLETDGYQGYNKVNGVKRCSCWAHIRRYFIDAIPKGKQFDYSQPGVQGVQYCDQLFRAEDYCTKHSNGDYQKRHELRLRKEKPILEAFWSWLDAQHPVRNSRMDKAVTYVQNRRATAETYLEDGRCSFTNNLSENAIRPFTVGRKNWLFSDSVAGAEASALVYTMVEMAKAHDLNVFNYLEYLLEQRPSSTWTDDQFAKVVPWSEELQPLKNRM